MDRSDVNAEPLQSDIFELVTLPMTPAIGDQQIRELARARVRRLVELDQEDGGGYYAGLPGIPTPQCWLELGELVAPRKPSNWQTRVYSHAWRCAMQLAFCGWPIP